MKTFSTEYTAKNLTKNAGLVNLGKFADKLGLPGILDRRLTIKRTVGRIRRAGAEPIMQTLARLSNEAQQGMITLLAFLLGVIPFLRSLLRTGNSNYRRIHIHSDPGKP